MIDLFSLEKSLRDEGQPYVVATVVRVEKPASARPGARAIITRDGNLTGWIGGSCTEPHVIQEAKRALQDGSARLLRICPPEKLGLAPQEGVVEVPITCASGGTLEIYIEPRLAAPRLLVVGHQAVAQALSRLGKELDYLVTVIGEDASRERFPDADLLIQDLDFSRVDITPNTFIVIASHGNYDEQALEIFLPSKAAYVALVTSKKRADAVRTYLRQSGIAENVITRLKYPAGLDFGAETPAEIALSILAEIIQLRRRGLPGMALEPELAEAQIAHEVEPEPETAVDPVCGMTVDIPTARYKTVYEGQTYYFCAAQCQHRFEKNPAEYLEQKINER